MGASTATQALRVSVRLPNTQTSYEGTLLNASREGLVVRLDTGEALRTLRAGASLLITINSAEAAYELMTQVRNLEGTQLNLQIVSPPKRLDRRRNKRYPVNLQVSLTLPSSSETSEPEGLGSAGRRHQSERDAPDRAAGAGGGVCGGVVVFAVECGATRAGEGRSALRAGTEQWAVGNRCALYRDGTHRCPLAGKVISVRVANSPARNSLRQLTNPRHRQRRCSSHLLFHNYSGILLLTTLRKGQRHQHIHHC